MLIDVTNALDEKMGLAIGCTTSGAEALTALAAGDDEAARDTVLALARDIGFEAVNAGPPQNARWLETLGFLNIQLATSSDTARRRGSGISLAVREELATETYRLTSGTAPGYKAGVPAPENQVATSSRRFVMSVKRVLFLSLVVFALAPAAWALCEDCIDVQCIIITPTGSSLVDGKSCSAQPYTGTTGFSNCRTHSGCKGCGGWTCVVRDPIDLELRVISVTVEAEKPANDAPPPQD